MKHGARYWALPACLLGGLACLCFLAAFWLWCSANEVRPFTWLLERVLSLGRAAAGGG